MAERISNINMKISLFRVDDRLIHGQVVVGWTRRAGVTTIIVADDKTASDRIQCSLYKMATPAGVKAYFYTLDVAAEKLTDGSLDSEVVMVLFKDPQSVLGLIERGVEIKELNLGNLRSAPGRVQLLNHVYAAPEDLQAWKNLDAKGVNMNAQILPEQKKVNFNETLKNF